MGDITATPTATATTKTNSVPTDTPTNTAVPTLIPTLIPSATRTPSATSTPSSTPSATKTSTATSSPTIASTRTSTPTVTATHSHTAISTATQTATPTATPTEATIPGALRIFQTSTTFKASVYGAEGAKAICVAIAQRAGLGGDDWDAIISEDGNSARDRLRIAGPIFLLNNTQIASSALDLWDGSISSRINITETGRAASSNNYLVWSGTNPNGTADTREHQRNCSNWSSVDGGAETGRTDAIDYRWLSIYAGGGQAANSCSNFGAFYCIEQRQVNTTRSVLSSDSYSSFQKRAERAKRLSLYELRGENLYFNIRFPGKGKSVGYYNVIVKRGKREHSSIIPSSNPSLLLGSKSLFATSPKVVVAVSALRSGMIVSSFTKRLRPQAIQIPNRIRVNKKHSNQKSALHNVKIETLSVLSHNKDNSYATTKDGALYSLSSAGKLSLVLDYSKITEAVGKITEVRKIGSQTFGVTDKGYLISTNNNNEPRADLLIQK